MSDIQQMFRAAGGSFHKTDDKISNVIEPKKDLSSNWENSKVGAHKINSGDDNNQKNTSKPKNETKAWITDGSNFW